MISIVHFLLFSVADGIVYLDHTFCLVFIGIAIKPSREIEIPKSFVPKPKKIEQENVFEVRPQRDGGKQGKSPLPYFMDDDGDIANEFYEEINHKLVKVSENKLKQV